MSEYLKQILSKKSLTDHLLFVDVGSVVCVHPFHHLSDILLLPALGGGLGVNLD